ncbi:MAG TPA: UvrB/UvrC motif-containing protein [Planctomycetota bacterium]|nr:UvrB/UvrC motif-containing protein [Planctomycetota bacterium]
MAMKCEAENCENEATVHLTEIREGIKHEMHLCEGCAAAKGLPGKPAHFNLQQLLAGIASQTQALSTGKTKRGKDPVCAGCGTTLSQFQASGRFGCPECYTAFKDDVQNLVEKIHDSTQHSGKVPRRTSSDVSIQKDLRQLQVELKKAIKNEEYERAAELRDKILKLEEKLIAPEEIPAPKAAPPSSTSAKKKRAE